MRVTFRAADESPCKPDSVPEGGDHPSGITVADDLLRSTHGCLIAQDERAAHHPRSCTQPFDLAPGGVCLATPITRRAGGLLHHRFTLTGS